MHSNAITTSDAARFADHPRLRQAVDQLVAVTFFDTLMKISENSAWSTQYGHGGRGEQVFRRQLNMELADQVARSDRYGLSESIYQRVMQFPAYARSGQSEPPTGRAIAVSA